jgi:hypothetical protein
MPKLTAQNESYSLPAAAFFSLRIRRNLLYDVLAVPSPKLLHQLSYPEQVFESKKASAISYGHKRISWHHCRPTRRNGAQTPFGIVEIDPVLAPVMAIGDQLVPLPP